MIRPVIKWSGSKRSQAAKIKSFFPQNFNCYFEPFIGGGSMLYELSPQKSICGDVCKPLIDLWKEIRDNPISIANSYRKSWIRLQEEGYTAYYDIRDNFNRTQSSHDLLFLSRTCVNGLIRFNNNGEFNNSLHYSRKGIKPDTLEKIIKDWSTHIKSTEFYCTDYSVTTETAKKGDVIYLDPPYFHTKGRYFGTIDFKRFLDYLEDINVRGIKFLLSFDGKRGNDDYTVELPKELFKRHEFIASGSSTFRKVIDKENEKVYESLYLNY